MVRQTKTGASVSIPINMELQSALNAMPGDNLTLLLTEFGKPFTSNGFGNWFRARCDEAGLPQCSAHGLRKAMSRRLAESGATNQQGRSITGHKTDTKARLAFALLLHTGQRRSDVVKMGRPHIKQGRLMVRQTKTGASVSIPINMELQSALNAMPGDNLTLLLTEFGKPFTSNGFGNWFRARCDEAGLPQCSAHGLRKAMSLIEPWFGKQVRLRAYR
jgi:integrase